MATFLTLAFWFLTGLGTAYFANQRGRDPYLWFAIGLFFGLFGLVFLFLLPIANDTEEKRKIDDQDEETLLLDPDVQSNTVDFKFKEWFYLDQSQAQKGPVSFVFIKSLWDDGKINSNTYVWADGMEKWKKIEELKGLSQSLLPNAEVDFFKDPD